MSDALVIGAGVVGLSVALELRRSGRTVRVIDKESSVGLHASGRNSGVLHAGFYYTADSLKAQLCRDGCARWKTWCDEHGVPVRRCGKLIVARNEADHAGLDELLRRARANGVELHEVSEDDVRRIEPRARTVGRALWSPTSASVDPALVMRRLHERCVEQGIVVELGCAWLGGEPGLALTQLGPRPHDLLVNAAGLYADRVAHHYGVGKRYRIVPFKGLYLVGDEEPGSLACHIYPVPDLGMPFLGVHYTVTASGHSKIGPTALPALWRENYGGLRGFSASEMADVVLREAALFLRDPSFRRTAFKEAPKMFRSTMLKQAAALASLDRTRWSRWGRPGIRAQLVDLQAGRLTMDFVVERGERSIHVLNAISPAFTCALPFAERLEGWTAQ